MNNEMFRCENCNSTRGLRPKLPHAEKYSGSNGEKLRLAECRDCGWMDWLTKDSGPLT